MEKERDIEEDIEINKDIDLNNKDVQAEDLEDKANLKSETEILMEALETEKVLSKEYLDKLQRNMAEFDNFRKRTTLEKSVMFENGFISAIEKFLPIFDNFERAIGSVSEEEKEGSVFIGLDMIFKQMSETFKDMGVEQLLGEGEKFDPNIHNAVLHIDDESFDENIIVEVLQKGYKYKEKLIRPSMVKVAN